MNPSRIAAFAILLGIGLVAALAIGGKARDTSVPGVAAVSSGDESAEGSNGAADAADGVTITAPLSTLEAAPPILRTAPEFDGLDGWLQAGDITSLADTEGQVRIVQIWTFACHNCKATIPHLKSIYDDYRDDGLEIIGVHAPEFDFEKSPEAIQEAAIDLGVDWPIALDTNRTSMHIWQERPRYWPRTYVVDVDGNIRYDHIGEGKYDELRNTVAYLLNDAA